MKKVSLLLLFVIVATSVTFSSYGNEKESKHDPIPGKITMTTSGGSRTVEFGLNRGDQRGIAGGTATIDWGDGSAIDTVKFSEDGLNLSYEYSDTVAYTITITSTDFTSFAKSGKRPVTSLDVSDATGLISLELGGYVEVDRIQKKIAMYSVNHQLAELNVSKNTALTYLKVDNTQLVELDVSKNTALTDLYVFNNHKLTELDVSNNTALKVLAVVGNQLAKLDVSKNTALIQLIINNNQLDASALNALFRTLHNYHLSSGVEMTFPEHLVGFRKIIEVGGNPGSKNCDPRIANNNGWGVKVDW